MVLTGPDGKYLFGMVKVGPKGQVVIPKAARDMHGIKPGDTLVIGGDGKGIVIFTDAQLNGLFKEKMQEGENQ